MKNVFIILMGLILLSFDVKAQKISKIFLNLYTDSLKKGTYNYINVDGQLANGNYIPLDSTEIKFWASDGYFSGNSLFVDKGCTKESILIRIRSKSQPEIVKEFTMYIKKQPDERLKTQEELLDEMRKSKRDIKIKKKNEKNA